VICHGNSHTRATTLLGQTKDRLPIQALTALGLAFDGASAITMKQVHIEDMSQLLGQPLSAAAAAWAQSPNGNPLARAAFAAEMLSQSSQGTQRQRVAP